MLAHIVSTSSRQSFHCKVQWTCCCYDYRQVVDRSPKQILKKKLANFKSFNHWTPKTSTRVLNKVLDCSQSTIECCCLWDDSYPFILWKSFHCQVQWTCCCHGYRQVADLLVQHGSPGHRHLNVDVSIRISKRIRLFPLQPKEWIAVRRKSTSRRLPKRGPLQKEKWAG